MHTFERQKKPPHNTIHIHAHCSAHHHHQIITKIVLSEQPQGSLKFMHIRTCYAVQFLLPILFKCVRYMIGPLYLLRKQPTRETACMQKRTCISSVSVLLFWGKEDRRVTARL